MPSGTLFINSRRRGKGFRRPAQKHLRFLRQLAKCDGIRVVDHMPQLVVRHGPVEADGVEVRLLYGRTMPPPDDRTGIATAEIGSGFGCAAQRDFRLAVRVGAAR